MYIILHSCQKLLQRRTHWTYKHTETSATILGSQHFQLLEKLWICSFFVRSANRCIHLVQSSHERLKEAVANLSHITTETRAKTRRRKGGEERVLCHLEETAKQKAVRSSEKLHTIKWWHFSPQIILRGQKEIRSRRRCAAEAHE